MQPQEQAELAYLPLFDLGAMLKSYRDDRDQHAWFAVAEATANVLTDDRLAIHDLRARFASQGEQFKVTIGDLTAEGFAFARKGYYRWMGNVGRWKGEHTVAKLETALRK